MDMVSIAHGHPIRAKKGKSCHFVQKKKKTKPILGLVSLLKKEIYKERKV